MNRGAAEATPPTPLLGPASARRLAGDQHRVLLARVARERFAFPLAELQEAVDAPEIIAVPLAAAGLAGQCAHRGRLLPVFDAGVLLGVPREGGAGALLVLDGAGGPFGLLLDDVEDMVAAPRRAWRALPAAEGRVGSVLRALLALDDGIAALVDVGVLRATVADRLRAEGR